MESSRSLWENVIMAYIRSNGTPHGEGLRREWLAYDAIKCADAVVEAAEVKFPRGEPFTSHSLAGFPKA